MEWCLNSDKIYFIRAALTCVARDKPAARKCCGFVGYEALRGCSKCLKEYPPENLADYSGYDREQWTLRDGASHRQHAKNHRIANTRTEQNKIERMHD